MGHDSTRLQRSFSHPSDASRESNEGDPYRDLKESVSFGRFTSETLDWGRWSSFTHNRYLEEAEKFSKPGSVAEKRALLEAHYKRIAAKRAEALLEEANTATAVSETNGGDVVHDQQLIGLGSGDSNHDLDDAVVGETTRAVHKGMVEDSSDEICDSDLVCHDLDNTLVQETKTIRQERMEEIFENAIMEDSETPEKSPSKSYSCVSVCSSKSPVYPRPSKLQSLGKKIAPRRQETNTSSSSQISMRKLERSKSSPKPVLVSSDSASSTGEAVKTSPLLKMFRKSRASGVQMSTDSLIPLGINEDSVNEESKEAAPPPHSENKSRRKSPSTSQKKSRLPTVVSPFRFMSEERVAKRKEFFEKLEEKNRKEAEKQRVESKPKERSEGFTNKLRQSLVLKSKPVAYSCSGARSSVNHSKVQPISPQSPKAGRKPTLITAEDTSCGPPRKPSFGVDCSNTNHVREKIDAFTRCCLTSGAKTIAPENVSPNIQF